MGEQDRISIGAKHDAGRAIIKFYNRRLEGIVCLE
jgi:hypothetical protein